MTEVAIGIPVYGRLDLVQRGLRAIDASTPRDVEIIVVDDFGPERVEESHLAAWLPSGRRHRLLRHEHNRGFVGSVNALFQLSGERDIVVVNSDVEVMPGWFEALAAAIALTPGRQPASASSLADNGGILSVPELATAPKPELLDDLRSKVGVAAEIPVAVAHCTWFTRAAIDRIGGFDERLAPGYGEEVDWSLRAVGAGFSHRAALGSYVLHAGSASFGAGGGLLSLQRRHEAILLWRYRRRWFDIRRFARSPDSELAVAKVTIARYLSSVNTGPKRPTG